MRRAVLGALLAAVVALAAGPAAADEPVAPVAHEPPAPVAPAAPAAPAKDEAPAKDDAPRDERGDVEVGGRLFVRERLASRDGGEWRGQLSLESARISVEYRLEKRLRAELTLEARRGDAAIRDAYLRLRLGHGAWLRGGRFKLPMSTIELASAWTLPTADRGFLADVLDDGLGVAGRRIGFAGGWRGEGALAPALELGIFQGQDALGDEQAAPLAEGAGLTVAARATIDLPGGVTVGLAGASRVAQATAALPSSRYFCAGLDAELDHDLPGGGVRAWAELLAGSSGFDTTPETTADAVFLTARAIVAWRLGGQKRGASYVEPYASAAVIEPNLDNADDVTWEAVVGVGAGQWKRWRLQLQGEVRRAGDLVPVGLGGAGKALDDGQAVTLQLGLTF